MQMTGQFCDHSARQDFAEEKSPISKKFPDATGGRQDIQHHSIHESLVLQFKVYGRIVLSNTHTLS